MEESLQCYSMPYGALGFVSHVITLYTLICLWRRRRPSYPWISLGNHPRWQRFIGITTLIVSIPFSAFTIIQCWNGLGSLVMQGFLNASVSFTLGCTVIAAGLSRSKSDTLNSNNTTPPDTQTSDIEKAVSSKTIGTFASSVSSTVECPIQSPESVELKTTSPQSKPGTSNWYAVWISLYFPFALVGLVGSATLVNSHWNNHGVQLVTVAAVAVAVCWAILLMVTNIFCDPPDKTLTTISGVIFGTMFFGVIGSIFGVMGISPFYSDWVLGAVVGNFGGLPITRNVVNVVVYWCYFVANLFPLACW